MFTLSRIHFADPQHLSEEMTKLHVSPLGKVRGSELPPEYELVRFIADVKNACSSWKVSTPAYKWKGVYCDADSRVTTINWDITRLREFALDDRGPSGSLCGSLEWAYLPRTVQQFGVRTHELSGTVPLDLLPPGLTDFCVYSNTFSGEVNLTNLPRTLVQLVLASNEFKGCVDFTHLPPHLVSLDVSYNQLSGQVDFSCLPNMLKRLDLSANQFEGPVSFDKIPLNLEVLGLQQNENLCGKLDEHFFYERHQAIRYSQTKIRGVNKMLPKGIFEQSPPFYHRIPSLASRVRGSAPHRGSVSYRKYPHYRK